MGGERCHHCAIPVDWLIDCSPCSLYSSLQDINFNFSRIPFGPTVDIFFRKGQIRHKAHSCYPTWKFTEIKLNYLFWLSNLCYFFRCAQQRKDLDISQNDMTSLIQVWYASRLCVSHSLVLFVVLLLGQTLVYWNKRAIGIVLAYSALFMSQCNDHCRVFLFHLKYKETRSRWFANNDTLFKDAVLPMMWEARWPHG